MSDRSPFYTREAPLLEGWPAQRVADLDERLVELVLAYIKEHSRTPHVEPAGEACSVLLNLMLKIDIGMRHVGRSQLPTVFRQAARDLENGVIDRGIGRQIVKPDA